MTEREGVVPRARRLRPETPKLLTALGIKFRRSGREWRGHCPEPTHAARSRKRDSGSWQINDKGQHHCFSCDFGGDAFGLVVTVRGKGLRDAAEWMIEHFGDELDPNTEVTSIERWKTAEPIPDLQIPPSVPLWAPNPGPDAARAIEYLLGRGLERSELGRYHLTATLDRPGVDYRGRVIVPVVVEGRLVEFVARLYVKAGDDIAKALSGRREEGARKELALWNYDRLDPADPTVYVTEGVWGAMALIRAGFSNTTSACGSAWSEDRTRLLNGWPRIVLIPDGDEAGRMMISRCSALRFNSEVFVFPMAPGQQPDDLSAVDLRERLGRPESLRKVSYLGDFESFTRPHLRSDLDWK